MHGVRGVGVGRGFVGKSHQAAKVYPCPRGETLGPTCTSIRPRTWSRKAAMSCAARALSASVAQASI